LDERDAERYRLHAEVCKVLTDPKRLTLIDALAGGERSVGELASVLGVTLANASQHLGVMRHAGIVETRREGTTVLYRLSEPEIVDACRIIDRLVGRRAMREPGERPAAGPVRPTSPVSPESLATSARS
jgi:DNA-binding transcriptional ArsR family regulator